jgi:ABC-type branched-subunit amino acid transport system permease subunit
LENRLRPPSGRRAAEGRGKKIPRRQRFAGGFVGFLAGFLLIFRTINSPFGEVLKSIRENEQRAISLGYKTDQYKLLVFILSGTLSGFAGSLKVFVAQNVSLTDVHWSMSGEIVLMTLVGGLGTIRARRWRLHHHRHAAISGRGSGNG